MRETGLEPARVALPDPKSSRVCQFRYSRGLVWLRPGIPPGPAFRAAEDKRISPAPTGKRFYHMIDRFPTGVKSLYRRADHDRGVSRSAAELPAVEPDWPCLPIGRGGFREIGLRRLDSKPHLAAANCHDRDHDPIANQNLLAEFSREYEHRCHLPPLLGENHHRFADRRSVLFAQNRSFAREIHGSTDRSTPSPLVRGLPLSKRSPSMDCRWPRSLAY